MKQINKNSFKSEVIDFKGVVVIDFYADWCNPCKMLSPLMEEMDKQNKDKEVKFTKVNVDAEPELAGAFGVMSIPTVVLFKNGKIINQKIGVAPKEEYLEMIKESKKDTKKTDGNKEVIIFTTPTCPYCHMAKDYLKSKNIKYKEIDVSRDQQWATKMVQKSGQMGVPQMWIGDQTVIGFNPNQIDMLTGK